MPELEITESQYERLSEIRTDVEAAFVDDYGHARLRDAFQYLLDTYTPPDDGDPETVTTDAYDRIATAEYPALQRVAADVPDVPGSGIDADEMRGRLLRELGPTEFATLLEGAADGTEGKSDRTGSEDGDTPADARANSSGGIEAGDSGTGGVLPTANRLLDEYADRWHEYSEGDKPYAVDLPDGTTETVRTKDDVRKLLFQHYTDGQNG